MKKAFYSFVFSSFLISSSLFSYEFGSKLTDLEGIYYKFSLSEEERKEVVSLGSELFDNYGSASLTQWKTFKNVIQDAYFGFKFDGTSEKTGIEEIFEKLETITDEQVGSGSSGSTGSGYSQTDSSSGGEYVELGDRLNSIIAETNRNFDQKKAESLTDQIREYSLEIFGSQKDRAKFLIASRMVRNKAKIQGFSSVVSDLDGIVQTVQDVSVEEKIQFLERINDGAFSSDEEKELFMEVCVDLVDNASKMSDDDLSSFYSVLVTAYDSNNFSDEKKPFQRKTEKESIGTFMDSLINIWNERIESGVEVEESESKTKESEQGQEAKTVASKIKKLESLRDLIVEKHSSRNVDERTEALSLKSEMIDLLEELKLSAGSLFTSFNFENTLLEREDGIEPVNEFEEIRSVIKNSIGRKAFSSEKEALNDFLEFFPEEGASNSQILEGVEEILSNYIAEEEKDRYLRRLDLLVRRAGSSAFGERLSQEEVERLEVVLNVAKNDDFYDYPEIDTLVEKLSVTPLEISEVEDAINASSVFTAGDVVAIRFGDSTSPGSKFLRVKIADDGKYYFSATSGGLVDTAAHFRLAIDEQGVLGLFSERINLIAEYDPSLQNIFKDFSFKSSSLNLDSESKKFYLVRGAQEDEYSLVSSENKGFLTAFRDGSVSATDFSNGNPLVGSQDSVIKVVKISDFYRKLAVARDQGDSFRINMYSEMLKDLKTEQEAKSILREVGIFLFKKRMSTQAWTSFLSDQALNTQITELIENFTTFEKAYLFEGLEVYISELKEILLFSDERNITLTPSGDRYFWLSETDFEFKEGDLISIKFDLATTGIFKVGFSQFSAVESGFIPEYSIIFGAEENSEVQILKEGKIRKQVEHSVLPEIQTYQITLDPKVGKISVSSPDSEEELIAFTDKDFVSQVLIAGFSSSSSQADLSQVGLGAGIIIPSKGRDIIKESFSEWISRLNSSAKNMRSADFELLDDLKKAASVKSRLEATFDDLETLSEAISYVENSWYFRNNSSADKAISEIKTILKREPTWSDRMDFLWNVYDQVKEYEGTDYDKDVIDRILEVIVQGLKAIAQISYQEEKQEEVSQFIGYVKFDRLFKDFSREIDQTLNSLENVFRIEAEENQPVLDRILVHQEVLPKLKTVSQRTIFLRDLNRTIELFLQDAQTEGSVENTAGKQELESLLQDIRTTGLFSDVSGSIELMDYFVDGGVFIEDALRESLNLVETGELSVENFMEKLEEQVLYFIDIIFSGLFQEHQDLKANILSYLMSLRNEVPKLGQAVDKLDFLIKNVQMGGSFDELLFELEDKFSQVNSVSKRNAFLNTLESDLVGFIEAAIRVNKVSKDDRESSMKFLNNVLENTWFKDPTSSSRVESFKEKIQSKIGAAIKISDLRKEFEALSVSNASDFVESLKSLSQELSQAVEDGEFSSENIQSFNLLIDEVDTKTASDSAEDGFGIIYTIRQDGELELSELKVEEREIISFNALIKDLLQKIDQVTSARKVNELFKSDFESLMAQWRKSTLLYPDAILNTKKFEELFEKAKNNFFINNVMEKNKKLISLAESEVLELKVDPQEKITLLLELLKDQDLEAEPEVLFSSLEDVVQDWKNFSAVTFQWDTQDGQEDKSDILELIDQFSKDSRFSDKSTQVQALEDKVNTEFSTNEKVAAINNNLKEMLALDDLSETQKDNLVEIITSAAAALKSLPENAATKSNKISMKNYVQELLDSDLFDVDQEDDLEGALKTLDEIIEKSKESSQSSAPVVKRVVRSGAQQQPQSQVTQAPAQQGLMQFGPSGATAVQQPGYTQTSGGFRIYSGAPRTSKPTARIQY